MKSVFPLTARRRLCPVLVCLMVGWFWSCSQPPQSFTLRANYAPVGKVQNYLLTSHRVGKEFRDGKLSREVDVKLEAEVSYTTQKMLPNGIAEVLEENRWHWDEPTDSAGNVKRVTREYTYHQEIAPSGKVVSFRMLGESTPQWENYARQYYEQGVPVFPDAPVMIDSGWTQKVTVTLPDGSTAEAATTYRIKGTAYKLGRQCVVIEYQGNMVFPLFPAEADTTRLQGIDRVEAKGILYYGYQDGIAVSSDESRRLSIDRTAIKEGRPIHVTAEYEEVIGYALTGIKTL
ncbi:MAG: hypothetical protein GYA46_04375 [candidate division Zixibacteria bacterium]|nr:hypothetical protein [candidate division Zixibacteria bacterium]